MPGVFLMFRVVWYYYTRGHYPTLKSLVVPQEHYLKIRWCILIDYLTFLTLECDAVIRCTHFFVMFLSVYERILRLVPVEGNSQLDSKWGRVEKQSGRCVVHMHMFACCNSYESFFLYSQQDSVINCSLKRLLPHFDL